jgi:hypothetical protein
MSISKSEKKKLCAGCRSERYNMGVGYQEDSTAALVTCQECWSLDSAKLCNKLVYLTVSSAKPYLKKHTLTCWHDELGYGEVIK